MVWISDPDRLAGERTAERFATRWVQEPDTSDIDAVVIAAPTQFHNAAAIAVIESGLPLLVEKPIADTLAHAEEIIAACAPEGHRVDVRPARAFQPSGTHRIGDSA